MNIITKSYKSAYGLYKCNYLLYNLYRRFFWGRSFEKDNTCSVYGASDRLFRRESPATIENTTKSETETVSETETTEAVTEAVTENTDTPVSSFESEKDLLGFLAEKQWYLEDTVSGEDYGRLTVLPDGRITIERLDSGLMCSGTLTPEKTYSESFDVLSLRINDLSEDFISDEISWSVPDEDMTDVMFFIGTGGGEDMLSLRHTGNGDTFTNAYILSRTHENTSDDILLHRESSHTVSEEPVRSSEFYAYCWKHDSDGMWFEEMEPVEKADYNEYTDRRFTSAAFVPCEGNEIIRMQVSDRIKEDNFLWSQKWSQLRPMTMYRLLTDERGVVYSMEEADPAFYGLYDLGSLPPEFSYDGVKLRYNHMDIDLYDEGFVTNQIMNVKQAGNRLVIEGHINPNKSEYAIFNMNKGEFEKPIYGANLVWQNDDVRSCVYSDMNTICDYNGNIVYSCDNDIYLLEITDGGSQLEITCFDDEYNVSEDKITIPYPENYDAAMHYYSDYLDTGAPSDWYRFMQYAPKYAAMFVITEPSECIRNASAETVREPFAGNTTSAVTAVPLYDSATIRISQGVFSYEDDLWKNVQRGRDHTVNKGEPVTFYANIPEGVPNEFIYMYTEEFSVDFPIGTISGEHPQQSSFIQISAWG